jgi:microcystin degradation protein MlrC
MPDPFRSAGLRIFCHPGEGRDPLVNPSAVDRWIPVFFEMMGLDIGRARSVAVKSRGHFRGGFDEFFDPERIVEVDLPGLTSPMLARFEWTRLPRPVIPLDDGVAFSLT